MSVALKLRLNPKLLRRPWQRGLDFCGYRIWPTPHPAAQAQHQAVAPPVANLSATYASGRASLADAQQVVASCIAYFKHANTRRALEGLLDDLVLIRERMACCKRHDTKPQAVRVEL